MQQECAFLFTCATLVVMDLENSKNPRGLRGGTSFELPDSSNGIVSPFFRDIIQKLVFEHAYFNFDGIESQDIAVLYFRSSRFHEVLELKYFHARPFCGMEGSIRRGISHFRVL